MDSTLISGAEDPCSNPGLITKRKMTADIRKKESHAINSGCLICSGRIKVSKRNCFEIFDKHVTEASGSPLYVVIAKLLEVEIREDSVHSTVICKLCLKKLNEVDEMEVKIEELKREIHASYQESIRMLDEVNINPPVEYNTDEKKIPLELSATAGEENIKYEINNTNNEEANNRTVNYVQQECTEQEENVAEEGEDGDCNYEIQEMHTADGICNNDIQEMDTNGECSDMEETGAGGNDVAYAPNAVVDTDMKALITPCVKATVKKTNKAKVSLPEKLVEREGIYFVCLLCCDPKIMGDRKGIVSHLKDVHNIRVYICDICLQYFKKRNDLSEHLDSHVATEEGEFLCEVCSGVFHNIRLYEVHKRIHFPQMKTWNCATCGKNYGSRIILEEHMNTHTGLRPYICEMCGKSFASKYTHQAHKKTHENRERSFSCDQCGKAFFRAASLKQHERTHADMSNYVCDQCGKAFVTARYLEVHSIVHTGYRPFACRMCGKDFARRSEMINHERTHTGEKPYQCEFCGATFSQRSNLQSHKRATHYQDKRYKCTLCEKGFKRQRLLDYHIRAAHTGERPYKCQTCNAAFIYPHHFKKHSRLHMAKV